MIGGFTGGYDSVVAGRTGAGGHSTVIERGWLPRAGCVAAVTRRRSWEMVAGFTGRLAAVVAGGAGARRNRAVIECSWSPGTGVVAAVTRCRRGNMVTRLAGRGGAVVALRASTGGDAGVIERHGRHPGTGAVAAVARRRSRNVVAGLACGCLPVMAARALARRAVEPEGTVVKTGGAPYGGRVAQITFWAGWNVVRRLHCGRYVGGTRVTAGAHFRCALKYSAHVTRLALH